MKKLTILCLLIYSSVYSQKNNYCTINPEEIDGLVVSGTFNLSYNIFGNINAGKNQIAHFEEDLNGITRLIVNGNFSGNSVWQSNIYHVNDFRGRMVNLDADGDGIHNEIAVLNDNGNNTMSLLIWQFDFNTQTWFFNVAYTSQSTYDLTKVKNRVVTGDFDNDGKNDDIATFYDYGNQNFKIHVFSLNGLYNVSYNWYYQVYGYDANKSTGRIVSGDFDRDNYVDDIGVLYDYGNNNVKMQVFKSNGNSFTQTNYYWQSSGYNPNLISGTLISGNFDKSGINNHKNDDIIALYDYGNGNVKIHYWQNNGNNGFNYLWKWQTSGFNVNNIRNKTFQFQPENDNPEKIFHFSGIYNYGIITNVIYKWNNNFNSTFDFSSTTSDLCGKKNDIFENDEKFSFYPNPANNNIVISNINEKTTIELYSLLGTIQPINIDRFNNTINTEQIQNGIYYLILKENEIILEKELIIINH